MYELEIPLTILERLPMPPAEGFEIRVLRVVREDSDTLYGFLTPHERELFRRLLGASGVGPKVALAMLSTYTATRLARALAEKDTTALTQVSGVGKKTGQRIILEMKAKLGQDAELSAILGEDEAEAVEGDDVIAALCSLGCTQGEAKKAATKARKKLGSDASDEDLVRAALLHAG